MKKLKIVKIGEFSYRYKDGKLEVSLKEDRWYEAVETEHMKYILTLADLINNPYEEKA